MAMPTTLSVDPDALFAKNVWEDPAITLERALEVRAQGGPPAGGPPESGPNLGFLGPLDTSGTAGQCL